MVSMNFEIKIKKSALKFIEKQSKDQQKRLLQAIYNLPNGDIKKLKGQPSYRLRVGDYRIIYTIEYDVLVINVIAAGNRGQIYE